MRQQRTKLSGDRKGMRLDSAHDLLATQLQVQLRGIVGPQCSERLSTKLPRHEKAMVISLNIASRERRKEGKEGKIYEKRLYNLDI